MGNSFISATIKDTGLQAGINEALRYSKRSGGEMVNTCLYHVGCAAYANTRKSQVQRITSELQVMSTLGTTATGKPSKAKRNRQFIATNQKPLAELIILARTNPNSKYNKLTGGRYALPVNAFKGLPKSLAEQKMDAFIDTMTKQRVRSVGFEAAGFLKGIKTYSALALHKFSPGVPHPPPDGQNASTDKLGAASPASTADYKVTASLTSLVGTEGRNSRSQNEALWKYGAPALQSAMDNEGRIQMKYALQQMEKGLGIATSTHWK